MNARRVLQKWIKTNIWAAYTSICECNGAYLAKNDDMNWIPIPYTHTAHMRCEKIVANYVERVSTFHLSTQIHLAIVLYFDVECETMTHSQYMDWAIWRVAHLIYVTNTHYAWSWLEGGSNTLIRHLVAMIQAIRPNKNVPNCAYIALHTTQRHNARFVFLLFWWRLSGYIYRTCRPLFISNKV